MPGLEMESTSLAEAPSSGADLGLEPTSRAEPEAPAPPEPAVAAEDLGALELEVPEIEAAPAEEPAASAVEGLPMLEMAEAPGQGADAAPSAPALGDLEISVPGAAPAVASAGDLELLDLAEAEVPARPTVADLEKRVKQNAQDWEARQLLGEARIE